MLGSHLKSLKLIDFFKISLFYYFFFIFLFFYFFFIFFIFFYFLKWFYYWIILIFNWTCCIFSGQLIAKLMTIDRVIHSIKKHGVISLVVTFHVTIHWNWFELKLIKIDWIGDLNVIYNFPSFCLIWFIDSWWNGLFDHWKRLLAGCYWLSARSPSSRRKLLIDLRNSWRILTEPSKLTKKKKTD